MTTTFNFGKKVASDIVKRHVTNNVTKQVFNRVASSNSLTTPVTGVVRSIPDTYRVINGKITSKEYGTRMAERGASIGGSAAGTWTGAVIGSCVCPGVGTTIGAFIGGVLGSMGGRKAASKCLR